MIHAVDLHAGGEPGRVIVGGVPDVPGRTLFEKKIYLETHKDDLRKRMLREPRGYPAANCNLILPPTRAEAQASFIIMEHTEYPMMSGSNTICVTTALIELGIVPATEPVTNLVLEAPMGLLPIQATVDRGKVTSVTFQNAPAFATHIDAQVEVQGLGTVAVDVAYGGMFYVIVEAAPLGLRITPSEGRDLVRIGEMIKAATREQLGVVHPEIPELVGVTCTLFTAPPTRPEASAKNTVIVSTATPDRSRSDPWVGIIDRSPCGTGTCARMAVLHAKKRLPLNQDFVHEGILGTTWTGRLIGETKVGPYRAVIPTLSGRAWITGFAQYVVDTDDPFPTGFILADIWGHANE